MAYATVAELQEFLGELPPEGSERALTIAKRLFDRNPRITKTLDFVDSPSRLTQTQLAAALRDASCAQVEYWLNLGGGKVDRSHNIRRLRGDGTLAGERIPQHPVLAPEAKDILIGSGLWRSGPHRGRSGYRWL